ncbi:hypothetical protein [Shewanella algae]|uniref:hypothetical protein n=1 Tax=Shewanella algae TaxID=38313 RepID=UPI001AAF2BBE|nr:hypothetical protein [Shewanella algae]MBO2635911.1 hypothetical protein [Shewanella algae]
MSRIERWFALLLVSILLTGTLAAIPKAHSQQVSLVPVSASIPLAVQGDNSQGLFLKTLADSQEPTLPKQKSTHLAPSAELVLRLPSLESLQSHALHVFPQAQTRAPPFALI